MSYLLQSQDVDLGLEARLGLDALLLPEVMEVFLQLLVAALAIGDLKNTCAPPHRKKKNPSHFLKNSPISCFCAEAKSPDLI